MESAQVDEILSRVVDENDAYDVATDFFGSEEAANEYMEDKWPVFNKALSYKI